MGDFDFLVGDWQVANRRLTERLVGSTDWAEFPGTSTAWSLFDGRANIDTFAFPSQGWSGMTVRLFDPRREEWSLYWASSRDGVLGPPVVGRFVDGRGEFYGDDTYEGTPVRIRYIWSEITPTSARWEQAFSVDGGRSWEINWVMALSRA